VIDDWPPMISLACSHAQRHSENGGGVIRGSGALLPAIPWKKSSGKDHQGRMPEAERGSLVRHSHCQNGTPPGLGAVDDLEGLNCIQQDDLTAKEAARQRSRWQSSLAHWKSSRSRSRRGGAVSLESGGEEAYPAVYRKEQGGRLRSPVAWSKSCWRRVCGQSPTRATPPRTPLKVASKNPTGGWHG